MTVAQLILPSETDRALWLTTAFLTLAGLITIFSTTSATESVLGGHLFSQAIKVFLGFGLFVLAHRIDYHFWRDTAPLIYLAGVLVLILVFVPGFGGEVRDVHRWIHLPTPRTDRGAILHPRRRSGSTRFHRRSARHLMVRYTLRGDLGPSHHVLRGDGGSCLLDLRNCSCGRSSR